MKKLLFSISIIYSIFAFSEEKINHFSPDDKATENSSSIIVQNNYASELEILDMDNRVKQRVLECQKFAEESPFPEINVMYDAVYEQENYPFLKHKL